MTKEQSDKINALSPSEAIFILTEINSCIKSIRDLETFQPSDGFEAISKEVLLMRCTMDLEKAVSRIGYTVKDFLEC